jgi:hypothetical protein
MKRLILILILTFSFQSWGKTDDIRDFQIEGMSIGDSALEFFTKDEFDNALKAIYPDDAYITLEFRNIESKIYDYVSFSYKKNDKNYITVAVSGGKYFDNKIKDCHKTQDEVYEEFKKIFPNGESFDDRIVDLKGLNGKIGTSRQSYIKLIEGGFAAVQCYDYDEKSRMNNMRVNLYSEIYNYWLVNEAYK